MKSLLKSITCFFLSALPAFVLTSCQTLINDIDPSRLPNGEKKLVVHGFISPQDSILSIRLSSTYPSFGKKIIGSPGVIAAETDAFYAQYTVTLSESSQTVNLVFNRPTLNFEISAKKLPVVAGRTYFLKIKDNAGNVYESSCTVPQTVLIAEVKQDSVPLRNNPTQKERVVQLFWQDPAGQVNYYRVGGYMEIVNKYQPMGQPIQLNTQIYGLGFESGGRSGSNFLTDQQADGTRINSGQSRISPYYFNAMNPNTTLKRIEYYLLSCDKSYYDYHRIVNNYDDSNPFVEPTLIPTNIKNGLGCFAAYTRSTFILKN